LDSSIPTVLEILVASEMDAYIFSLTDLTWRKGPPMGQNLHAFTSVQLDDGFMVLGGIDENDEKA